MGNTGLGKFWSKMTGEPPRNRRAQNNLERPLLLNTNSSNQDRTNNSSLNRRRLRTNTQPIQRNVSPIQGVLPRGPERKNRGSARATGGPARATGGPAIATGQVRANDGPAIATGGPERANDSPAEIASPTTQQLSPEQIRRKMNIYCFKKSRNIVQIHQRHATTCANVLNKGFDAKGEIGELAPNTSLTAIGIQQCMQVSDFLLYCKSININYITGQKYQTIDALKPNNKIKNSGNYVINTRNENNKNNSKKTIDKDLLIDKIDKTSISTKELIKAKLNEEIKETSLNLTRYKTFLNMLSIWRISVSQNDLKLLESIGKEFTIKSNVELVQKKELRPMLIFCCSELLRTQQTLFITYFDIIKDYLKNRRKIIVLFWLNEKHGYQTTNADNFVVSLAHTKQQWRYFIKRIKNLEFDKDFIENIGREVGKDNLVEFSKKLNLEEKLQTSTAFSKNTINYEEWEDIFYVSSHIYPIRDPKARLLDNFSFDNRRFSSGKRNYFVGKKMWDPKEMYRELPAILSQYLLDSTIITHDSDYGVDFYEERIGPDVKMNIVFVSHHSSGENTIKYATNETSVAIFKEKQQLMNCELVILPKGGILGKKEYGREFGGVNDDEYKNLVKSEIKKLKIKYDGIINENRNVQIRSINLTIESLVKAINENTIFGSQIQQLENSRNMLLNKLYPQQDSISENSNIKLRISLIETMIIYSKYLNSIHVRASTSPEPAFSLKNRIFPVGFYDSIITSTVKRKNKTNQFREIYPLFILYNSQLGIFFTPLDVVKQEVAIIPEVIIPNSSSPAVSQQVGGIFGFGKKQPQPVVANQVPRTGIQASSQIFSLSSPFGKFLDMSLEEYIKFLGTFKSVIDQINKMYNPQQSVPNVPAGVASAAVERPKGNIYFYDYAKLSVIVQKIKEKISQWKSQKNKIFQNAIKIVINQTKTQQTQQGQASEVVAPSKKLIDYLRENFDTKTLVHNFGKCLFDFCATTEPARNKLRKIVREKLKLEVVEKDYKDIFSLEVQRQLQKFIDDYEKESRFLSNNSSDKVIPVSKGLFSTIKESKKQILEDINKIKKIRTTQKTTGQKLHDFIDQFVSPLLEIYKKYNIIDNSLIQKINSLRTKSDQNMSFQKGENFKKYKNEKFKEITEMLHPYQKKFLDSIINKNTRHKNGPKNEKIQNKNKQTVDITNTTTPLKKSKYIVIKNKNNDTAKPVNYIKYQNIPIAQRR